MNHMVREFLIQIQGIYETLLWRVTMNLFLVKYKPGYNYHNIYYFLFIWLLEIWCLYNLLNMSLTWWRFFQKRLVYTNLNLYVLNNAN